MYYSNVEIEYVATSFSPARTDLALKLLRYCIMYAHYINANNVIKNINDNINDINDVVDIDVNINENWLIY